MVVIQCLTDDQRAIITDELIEKQSKINIKQKTVEAGKSGGKGRPKQDSMSETSADKLKPKQKGAKKDTRKEVSKQAKVSEWKVKKARKLRKEKPKLAEEARKGNMTLQQAEREIKEEKREQQRQENENIIKTNPKPFPNQKFATIMIDPPFSVSNAVYKFGISCWVLWEIR